MIYNKISGNNSSSRHGGISMPAAYAHNRFGQDCISLMPDKLKALCLSECALFNYGVHGPDILFYYHPLISNEINRFGSELHHCTGKIFFEPCPDICRFYSGKSAMLAYLLGFLAHFALDSSCHSYINTLANESPFSHNLIESQFDAYLMRLDGHAPLRIDRSKTLQPSHRTAEVIARFFPFREEQIFEAIKGQKKTLHLFYSPDEYKKKLIQNLIRKLRISGSFEDLFLDAEELPACSESNEKLSEMYAEALSLYPLLMRSLIRYLRGNKDLLPYFDHDFEGNDRSVAETI